MGFAVSITSLMFNMISIIIIIIVMMHQNSCTAQSAYRNVSLGTSIVADHANVITWLSPSGEFAFGFQQVSPGGYLLAIWFDKIPEKNIVWSANRDKLAPQRSRIQLLPDGRLQLNDPLGKEIWAVNQGRSGVAYGAMLDTGDFVLATNTSSIMWRSFDEPTDTLLPSQILNQGISLTSSFSEGNYSKGRFKFTMQGDGNLVLYTRNFPMDTTIRAYWATMTLGSGFQLIFNQSGYVSLIARNGTILNNVLSTGVSTSQFYQRLTLEYDGVLRHYVYPKSGNTSISGRAMVWSVDGFLPENICTQIIQDTGGGACGFNSVCTIEGINQRPRCSCPAGYSPIDPQDRMSGCKQDFIQQSCGQENQEDGSFIFSEMTNTDWPNRDYAAFEPVNEEWCRQACLADCLCSVAIFKDNKCMKRKVPLSCGRTDPSVGGKALIKIRLNNTMDKGPSGWNSRKSSRSTLIIIGSVLLGSSVFVNLLLLASVLLFGFRFIRRRSTSVPAISATVHSVMNQRSFSFTELQAATNGFKEELGRGACSIVYKGVLNDENGTLVAIKKLLKLQGEVKQEFEAEVSSISRTNHKNLVQLLGYCDEGENKLLVYEFMSNGSLASFLFESSSRPNWYRRLQIAFAIARGLCYLHEECSTQIIHCDIKPQNVLLDDSHTPKISDFGLAKLLRPDQTRTTTGIRGTRGYVAPEWFRNLPITSKVDVYSFGILLLELLCCKKNFEADAEDEREAVLADWAYDCYMDGTLHLLVADDEEVRDDMNRFEKFVMIAIWCTQEDPALRPQMKRVMHMLEGSAEIPAPPNPASFIG